jgi:hypothetical protein
MPDKQTRDRYYDRILRKSLKRHPKIQKGTDEIKVQKRINWNRLNNFLKTKHNEQSNGTNDSGS